MRRIVLAGAAWLVATVLATVLAWRAVELVSSEVTARPAAPLSNEQVARALGATGEVAAPTTDATDAAAAPPEPGGGEPAAPRAGGGPATSSAPRTTARPPTASAPTSASTTAAPSGGSSGPQPEPAPASTTSTTSTTLAAPVTRTIASQGGQVAVRYDGGRVELLWARPASGFTVDVDKAGPTEVDVRFESDDHRSRVRAYWRDGGPAEEVREEAA